MKKFTFLKTVLTAVCMLVGVNAWGAGYTRTLTDALEVTGYKAKAFYNFQTNTPEVLPTSGDLRYRDGNIWGLHNFGSGTRSATATISVAQGDILVIQEYSSSYVTTINRGTQNNALTTSTGYRVFDITTTADDITFTTPRYGGIVAAFVMEKDDEAATADYTIYYKDGETIVKTVSGSDVAVGTPIYIESSFFKDDVKYVTDGGQISSFVVANGTNVYNIEVSEAAKYSYTVNATDGTNVLKVLASGSTYEGEQIKVAYPRYFNIDGTLYTKAAISSEYRQNVTISEDNQVVNFVYSATDIKNVVYYSEGEEVTGASEATGGNMPIRSSNAKCGIAPSDITLINLPAGTYQINVVFYAGSSAGYTIPFMLGDEAWDAVQPNKENGGGASNWIERNTEFTLNSSADIKWLTSGNNTNGLDYVYIQKTADIATITSAGWATLYTPYALDFSGVEGLTAYTATYNSSESTVTLTEVSDVPANTGVVLKGAEGSYAIPVIVSSETEKGDLKGSATEALTYDEGAEYDYYMLAMNDESEAQFTKLTSGTIAAGKAYLQLPKSAGARTLNVVIAGGETTGISDASRLNNKDVVKNIYNLNGQRVEKAVKGLYISNGKKVIIK